MHGIAGSVAISELMQIKHLPPLSTTATRLLEAVADNDISLRELAGIIEFDPGLAARVLGLANSAYFGQAQPVNSVEEAIIRVLGLKMVKALSLSLAVAGSFDTRRCHGFDLVDYWYKALASAQLARLLSLEVKSGKTHPDEAFLGGLFHNLGTLFLVHAFPDRYSQVLVECGGGNDLPILEQQIIGIDRVEAGVWIARRWHLPEPAIRMMANVGATGYDGPHAEDVSLVNGVVEWVYSQGCEEPVSLAWNQRLLTLDGLGPDLLADIEEDFRAQCDQLKGLAGLLA
jgi:HD-like signal output (HDOD) protein